MFLLTEQSGDALQATFHGEMTRNDDDDDNHRSRRQLHKQFSCIRRLIMLSYKTVKEKSFEILNVKISAVTNVFNLTVAKVFYGVKE